MRVAWRDLLATIHPLWQIGFYLVPVGMLCIVSFWLLRDFQPTPAWNLQNYGEILRNPVYVQGVFSSVKLAITCSILSLCLAIPIAYGLTFALEDKLRRLALFLLLWPFFSNYVTRMFSLQLCLGNDALVTFLRQTGFLGVRDKLLYSEPAVVIGLLSILVPVSAIIIYLSLARLDRTLLQASRNLGATGVQTFFLISFPFALPGILGAFMYSFIVTIGDFVCPRVLGGNQLYTISILIEDRLKVNDWPVAAALGVVMMVISTIVMFAVLIGSKLAPTARFANKGVSRP